MLKPEKFLQISAEEREEFIKFSQFSEVSVIFLSLDFCVIDFNEKIGKIYQWNRKDILNKSYLKWCEHQSTPPPILFEDKDALLHGYPKKNIENTINDQHTLLWTAVASLDKGNIPNGIVLIGEEVTYKKHFAHQIQELANTTKTITGSDLGSNRIANDYLSNVYTFLENIIACMPCYVFWKDRNFIYLGCNDLIAKTLSLSSRHDIIGKTDYDFGWDKEKVDEFRKIDEKIVSTREPQLNFEETVEIEGGYSIDLLVNKMPILDTEGKVIGIVGISVDITEHKRTVKQLIKAKEEAEAANRAKTDFIHNMEHDIRTPFNGIVGLASILLGQETDLIKKEIIADILYCTTELLNYSNGILDFSKIESGSLPILHEKFDLKLLLEGLMKMEIPAAKLKALDFSLDLSNEVPTFLIGDKYRLQRILINLVSNAIKFTNEGYVQLSVKFIKLIDQRNIILQFIVKDSGIGISKEMQNVIYERFSRTTPSNFGAYKGQGLGLSIVKRFINEMDGDIDIDSVLGDGTKFICTLPFKIPLVHVRIENP